MFYTFFNTFFSVKSLELGISPHVFCVIFTEA